MPAPNETKPAGAGKETLGALFLAEESALLRYAFSLVGRRAVAEEVVQEVFLQLHHHWETVQNPRAWLYRSVRNRSYNHIRDHRREVLSEDKGDREQDQEGEAPDEALGRMEAAGYLRHLMAELEAADQELIQLKYYEGLKYREISERTGLSIGNVGYRLHHILKQLADKLRQIGIEGSCQ